MTYVLRIQDTAGDDVSMHRIGDCDPAEVAIVVLTALRGIKPKRKQRSDSGKSRGASEEGVIR